MIKVTKKGKKTWVTFTTPAIACESIEIKGSWNDWEAEPMKRKKSGEFYITKVLPTGENYEFGYLCDGREWMTEETLPTVGTVFGSENSVLKL
ncbi:isoamylase early set domain-containing protein [Hydrogenimonas cancrithermarum]|uniref:AMP-activated protein kinase glycogen-binding domain-containing protein n=1 Tax=Hydrogenimonas cancrithermarum TaxID=2993563 RepID=A0ABN6WUC7_9BACT|nr:isoamylase early set domain-containing protein [Hydrogenimonas cancrithermarum]BDY11737.1 hypothetical protein HCR_00490 [Hydrogenimonas cancrithermarum]